MKPSKYWGIILFCFSLPIFAWDGCYSDTKIDLEKRTLSYFLDNMHPKTGLVLDRAINQNPNQIINPYSVASMAATGFGAAVIANAALQGWVSIDEAEKRIGKMLLFVRHRLRNHQGWFYHFVNWETGTRAWQSEVSTIDTSFFIAGILYAAEALGSSKLIKLANEIYIQINFEDMLTDGGNKPLKETLSMGWLPESGYISYQWDQYAEHLLLLMLGIGHPTKPISVSTWKAWKRQGFQRRVIGPELPLFAHQYSGLFYDFRRIANAEEDFFINTEKATKLNKKTCENNQNNYFTFKAGFWGLSASDSKAGYSAYSPTFYDGTVCLACAGASVTYEPCSILSNLKEWKEGIFQEKIWGNYGFVDSFNIDNNWFDKDVIGITVGALYLSLANLNLDNSIWKIFQKLPAIQNAEEKIKIINL